MNKVSAKVITLLMGLFVVLATGCAQVAHKVDVLYSPLPAYRGGTGSLELVTVEPPRDTGSEPSIRWVVGHITNAEGGAAGDISSPIRPQDVIKDAFKQELGAAGYQINYSKALDKDTKKGIVLKDISVQIGEIPSFAKLESSCIIFLKLDLWMNGALIRRTEYRSKVSDVAVMDRDQLSSRLYQKAIQDIMQQAVPDIIRQLN